MSPPLGAHSMQLLVFAWELLALLISSIKIQHRHSQPDLPALDSPESVVYVLIQPIDPRAPV
ncbi:hypothetical protein BGAL_0051g00290 [Botrytis galanthina]|uniref:Uncharacterized protein n=1 Tax=Botrytis galanthina TaxID=278940 RepID=A0A4S8R8W3_9HELO|nr:hypothetical protein BGAL_0051g00290 [Botrytis galanthina]